MVADDMLDELLREATPRLGAVIGATRLDLDAEATVRDVLAEVANALDRRWISAGRPSLGFQGRENLVQRARDELFGLGVLQQFADDHATKDIVITGPHTGFANRDGAWVAFHPGFASAADLEEWSRRFVERHGHHVDHAAPEADFALSTPDGRFHVVIPPAAGDCAQISIRLQRQMDKDLVDLVGMQTMSEDAAALLDAVVGAKLNTLVSGGGSTGKTTTTNALGRAIPRHERVVTIEDLAELQLSRHLPMCSTLFTHRANIEGKGERRIEHLIPMALRMCADRIVVGEVRSSAEAGHVLDVMNTGHEGSITTIHANTANDALDRLVTLVGAGGTNYEFALRRVAQTVAFVIHMRKLAGGARVVETITEVDGIEKGVIRASHIFKREGGRLVYQNRPREAHYERLVEAGWDVPRVVQMEVGKWR
jgi:pilus assembly protein CpaF